MILKKPFLFGSLFILSIISILVGVKDIGPFHLTMNDLHILSISRLPQLIGIIVVGASFCQYGSLMGGLL